MEIHWKIKTTSPTINAELGTASILCICYPLISKRTNIFTSALMNWTIHVWKTASRCLERVLKGATDVLALKSNVDWCVGYIDLTASFPAVFIFDPLNMLTSRRWGFSTYVRLLLSYK